MHCLEGIEEFFEAFPNCKLLQTLLMSLLYSINFHVYGAFTGHCCKAASQNYVVLEANENMYGKGIGYDYWFNRNLL